MSKKPNWLLRGLILVSIAIHALVFMHLAGLYKSRAWTYIELTLRSYTKPHVRDIPRPPPPKPPPRAVETDKGKLTARSVPSIEPSTVQTQKTVYPDSIAENIVPAAPPVPASPEIGRWEVDSAPSSQVANNGTAEVSESGDADTADTYFSMVRASIEYHKAYPESARLRNVEGRVVVGFILQLDGRASSIEVIRKSRHPDLNHAALDAVKKASPFPKPPARLFKKAIPLQIAIAFEIR